MIQDADDRDLKRQLMPTANEPIPEGGGTVTEKSELPSAPQHPEVSANNASRLAPAQFGQAVHRIEEQPSRSPVQ